LRRADSLGRVNNISQFSEFTFSRTWNTVNISWKIGLIGGIWLYLNTMDNALF
jgi:hypothetical protein